MSFLLFGISFDALKDYTRTFCGPEGANEPGIIGVFLRFFNVFPPGLFFGTVFSFYGLLVADSAFQDLTQNLTGYYEYNIKYYTSWENIILYVVIFFICLETTFGLLLSHFAGGFDVTFSLVILMSQLVQTIFSLAVLCLSICGTMLGALFSSTIFPFEMFRRYCNFADVYSDLYCISGKNYGFFYSTLYLNILGLFVGLVSCSWEWDKDSSIKVYVRSNIGREWRTSHQSSGTN
ncbi:hypothetical protein SNEBB_009372 [Seison nebaliae]|nr:hypothetical protein SNEBB_009372 [Seison nebaliae]